MAFQTFKPSRKVIALEVFERNLARRREAIGKVEMPRNSGARRTARKEAILAAIKAVGGRW